MYFHGEIVSEERTIDENIHLEEFRTLDKVIVRFGDQMRDGVLAWRSDGLTAFRVVNKQESTKA